MRRHQVEALVTGRLETWRTTLAERLAGRPEGFSDGKRLIPGRAYPPLHPLRP
jgi:hypothetical protein